jgi:hypothetical protein
MRYRVIVAVGLMLIATGVAPAGPRSSRKPDVAIVGSLEIKRGATADDTFVIRVATNSPIESVILVEQEIRPGKFRVSFPALDVKRRAVVVITSNHHQPMFEMLESGARGLHIRKPLRPKPWVRGTVRVTRAGGPVANALVTWSPGPVGLTFLHLESRTTNRGIAEITAVADRRLQVRAEDGPDMRQTVVAVGADTKTPIRIRLGRPGGLSFHLRLGAIDPTLVTVRARTADGWTPVTRWEGTDWRGAMPERTSALRVECPGLRPVLILDPKPDHTEKYQYRLALRPADGPVGGPARLFVKKWHAMPLDAGRNQFGMGCGGCVGGPDRVGDWAQVRKAGADAGSWGGFRSRNDMLSPDWIHADLAAGSYEVRFRGDLGLPRRTVLDLPADTDVLASVAMSGGSAIRLIVRDGKKAACPRVSFRVTDALGAPVRVVYVPRVGGRLPADPQREWSDAWYADRFTDVSGTGRIQLEPGTWRIEIQRPDAEPQIITVRTYPEMITRVDVSPPKK